VNEELNLPLDALSSNPLLVGVIAATASRGKPTAIFYVECKYTAQEVATSYVHGTQSESTHLAFVSTKCASEKRGPIARIVCHPSCAPNDSAALPKDVAEMLPMMTPSSLFALSAKI